MILLFIDRLGVRNIWRHYGRAGAEEAFRRFEKLIAEAIEPEAPFSVLSGVVESDAAAVTCSDIGVATRIARRAFLSAFLSGESSAESRVWLRGVIVPQEDELNLFQSTTNKCGHSQLKIARFSGPLLDAIALEKCGFKGMRVLVKGGLGLEKRDFARHAHVILAEEEGKKRFTPFRKIHGLGYPGPLPAGYRDFLWMSCSDESEWEHLKGVMVRRLRWSAGDPPEFEQAAATQSVFHECGNMIGSIKNSKNNLRGDKRRKLGLNKIHKPTSR